MMKNRTKNFASKEINLNFEIFEECLMACLNKRLALLQLLVDL